MNEELQNINSRLETKVHELEVANNDLHNLLSSIDYAMLFLDRRFCIKRFTPVTTRMLRIIDTDIGRPLSDFAKNITDETLLLDAEKVLQQFTPIEREFQDTDQRWYMRRIVPYRTGDDRIDGVVITFVDMTRAKQDAQALELSERRFERFMQHMPGLAWIKDVEGRYVYADDAALAAFGRTRADLYGRTDDELFPAETASQFQENDRKAVAGPQGIQTVETLQHPDGTVHHSIVAKFPIPNIEGTVASIGGMAVDITDRLRAEERLREAQQQLQLVADSMAVAVTRCRRDLRYLWVNRHCAEWLGYSPDELVGRPFVEILGEKACEQLRPYYEQVLSGQQVSFEQQINYDRLGSTWVHAVYSPTFDASGDPDGWVAVVEDISERKCAEDAKARLAAIVESSEDAIIGKTLDGVITSWNRSAEKLYGYTAHEMIGRPISCLAPPDRLDEFSEILNRLKNGESIRNLETVRACRDGSLRHVSLAVSPIRDSRGAIVGASSINRDITQRKRAESALRESEERLRLATESAQIGTWQWELENNRASWSEMESELIGCDPALSHDDVQDFFDRVHPDDRAELRRAIDRAIERDEPYDHEFRVLRPDGRTRWLAGKGEVYRDDRGNPVKMMGVNFDIDDRKRAEETLAELNDQLKKLVAERTANTDRLLEEAPDAVVMINRQGQIMRINHVLATMFGFGRDELLGETIEMLLPDHMRARHPTLRDSYFAHPRVHAMGLGLELTARHKDGHEFPVEIQLTPLIINGEAVTAASIRDVTERKQFHETQARLAALMKNTSTAVWVLDLEGTVLYWNRGAERLFGYSAEEMVGHCISQFLPPERSDEVKWDTEQLVGGQLEVDYDTVRLHKDGRAIDVSITKTLILQDQGAMETLVIARDIREQKRLEQQMAEIANAERQRLGRELHDSVGQDCTAISMLVATLKQQSDDSPIRAEILDRLEKTAEAAKKQLRQLNRGLLPVDLDANGLRVALQDLAEETHHLHDVECRFECFAPIVLEDNFVATQLFQIVREAVHNAIKHSQANHIVIRVEKHSGICITIRDDGLGLPQTATGTCPGMGLRIMRYRCGLIGGRIRFDAAQHGGTLVEVFLAPTGAKRIMTELPIPEEPDS